MHTLKQQVDEAFEFDYDNMPGVGPKMLFRKLGDGTMTLATPGHIVEFIKEQFGIADPAAFVAKVREVADQYVRCARHTPFDLCHAIDELAAMLPPETAS